MSFVNVMELLEAGAIPELSNAIRTTGMAYLRYHYEEKRRGKQLWEVLCNYEYEKAREALFRVGWTQHGHVSIPDDVARRCRARLDWYYFRHSICMGDDEVKGSVGWHCAVYVWAHKRNLL